jgi:hypothetical protein
MVIQPKLVKILIVSLMLTRCAMVHGQNQSADLVAQAKKEWRVTWYTTVSIPESKQFMDMFEKQYPFIKVDLLRSGSGATSWMRPPVRITPGAADKARKIYRKERIEHKIVGAGFKPVLTLRPLRSLR